MFLGNFQIAIIWVVSGCIVNGIYCAESAVEEVTVYLVHMKFLVIAVPNDVKQKAQYVMQK